jgi:ADP-glucose pyrophosphorylase
MKQPKILAFVMAGGEDSRLSLLSVDPSAGAVHISDR